MSVTWCKDTVKHVPDCLSTITGQIKNQDGVDKLCSSWEEFLSERYDVHESSKISIKITIGEDSKISIKLMFVTCKNKTSFISIDMTEKHFTWLFRNSQDYPPTGTLDFLSVHTTLEYDLIIKLTDVKEVHTCEIPFEAWKRIRTIINCVTEDLAIHKPHFWISEEKTNPQYVLLQIALAIAIRRYNILLNEHCYYCRAYYDRDHRMMRYNYCQDCVDIAYAISIPSQHPKECIKADKTQCLKLAEKAWNSVQLNEVAYTLILNKVEFARNFFDKNACYVGPTWFNIGLVNFDSNAVNPHSCITVNHFLNKIVENNCYLPLSMHMLAKYTKLKKPYKQRVCQRKGCDKYACLIKYNVYENCLYKICTF